MRKLVAVPSATSPESRCALPDAWVRRIFERMEDRYGDLWAQRFGGVPKDRLMRTWAEDLSDLSGEEIACGLRACRDHKFVPSLPDFRALCRPPIDFDGALLEAIEQMARRESGRDRCQGIRTTGRSVARRFRRCCAGSRHRLTRNARSVVNEPRSDNRRA